MPLLVGEKYYEVFRFGGGAERAPINARDQICALLVSLPSWQTSTISDTFESRLVTLAVVAGVTLSVLCTRTKIIPHREQLNRMDIVFKFLREDVCQLGNAASMHPNAELAKFGIGFKP